MDIVRLKKEIEKAAAKAHFSLRKDVLKLLKKAYCEEKDIRAKNALNWILENANAAEKDSLALCQDTGLPIVFIEAGKDINLDYSVVRIIESAIEKSYHKNYLRPSIDHPLKRGSPSYKGSISHIEFSKGKGLKITIFPKGFGSENKSQLKMFNPTVSIEEIEKFVVESVQKAGPEACPPFIVGVGIGGTSDYALLLAKKALLERLDKKNKDKSLVDLEKKWLKAINELAIGPMGLGGNFTALAVKIKTAPTHIAGLPVGINISCHALRSVELRLGSILG